VADNRWTSRGFSGGVKQLTAVDEGYYDEEVAAYEEELHLAKQAASAAPEAAASSEPASSPEYCEDEGPVPSEVTDDEIEFGPLLEAPGRWEHPTWNPSTGAWLEPAASSTAASSGSAPAAAPKPSSAPAALSTAASSGSAPAAAANCYADPQPVRPTATGRQTDLTRQELTTLRTEQVDAVAFDVAWKDRGPSDETAENWRGQRFRPGHYGGTKRYAKRGGKNQAYYGGLAAQGMLQPTRNGAVRVEKGEAKGAIFELRAKGKGQGKSKEWKSTGAETQSTGKG
jgi:hypothetical protein